MKKIIIPIIIIFSILFISFIVYQSGFFKKKDKQKEQIELINKVIQANFIVEDSNGNKMPIWRLDDIKLGAEILKLVEQRFATTTK